MTAVWVAAVAAVIALVVFAASVSKTVVTTSWPEDAPLNVRENRANDQQLAHLARLLAIEDPTAAHRVVREVTDRLLTTSYRTAGDLPPPVAAFLADPPLASPERYRRELAAALDRIEDL